MKRIALTCKDPGQFFRDCRACKFYEKCDYFNKEKRKKKKPGQNPQTDCNHDYEFKASQFKGSKLINFYTGRKCGERLKVYNENSNMTGGPHERRK